MSHMGHLGARDRGTQGHWNKGRAATLKRLKRFGTFFAVFRSRLPAGRQCPMSHVPYEARQRGHLGTFGDIECGEARSWGH